MCIIALNCALTKQKLCSNVKLNYVAMYYSLVDRGVAKFNEIHKNFDEYIMPIHCPSAWFLQTSRVDGKLKSNLDVA